jgi:hypothetical protein
VNSPFELLSASANNLSSSDFSPAFFKGPFGGEMTAFVTTSLWLCFAVVFARKLCSCCCFEKTVKVKKRCDDFGQFDGRFDTDNTRKE